MMNSGPFTAEARHQNKSARTRARLMDAAVQVFARDGFEAASVNEIARMAEVANGTFYVHFKDKDAIAVEVAARIATDITDQIDRAMADIDDGLERFGFATRQFIEFASHQPQWGWVIIRAASFLPQMHRQMETHMCADLERGRRQGQITADIDAFLVDTIMSMVFAALAARLRGDAGPEAGSRVTELVLNMLNIPPQRAHAIAWQTIALKELHLPTRPRQERVSPPAEPVRLGPIQI